MNASDGNNAAKRNDRSKEKCAAAERNFYMKPLLRLKHDEEILERGLITAMENMKIKPNLLQSILREHRQLSLKRQNFLDTMRKNIKDINSDLESVKIITRNPQEIEKLDVVSYKQKLMKLSEKMQDFEKSCPLQTLKAEGDVLNSELRDSEPNLRKYEMVEKNAMLSSQSWPNKIENKKANAQYKDVNDFHTLVAATGHTEHWTVDDHRFFLKMRNKCEGIPALVAAIRKKFPDLSPEAIVNHDAWFKEYHNLRGKQKEAVIKWRQRQQQELKEKEKISRVGNEIENYQEKADPPYKIEEEKEVNTRESRRICKPGMRSTSSSASSNDSEKKELIRKWRMEKENKRSMDEEQIKLQMKLKKEMDESRRRRRRERLQEALGEYKQRKTLENALRERDDKLREKSKYSTTLIKAFREQDEEFTKKRKDLISRCKRPSKNDLLELKKVELAESREYSMLMDPTKVWREKCKVEYSMGHSSDITQYIHIQGVP